MQASHSYMSQATEYCQLDIFPDEDLYFSVRVLCGGKRFLAGGFMSPDEAHRHGIHALLAMSGFMDDEEM